MALRTDFSDTTPQLTEHMKAHNDAAAAINTLLAAIASGVIPPGGTVGQVLEKATATDGAVKWASVSEVPLNGTVDQVLTRTDTGAGQFKWRDPASKTVGVGGITGWLQHGDKAPTSTPANGTVFLVFDAPAAPNDSNIDMDLP